MRIITRLAGFALGYTAARLVIALGFSRSSSAPPHRRPPPPPSIADQLRELADELGEREHGLWTAADAGYVDAGDLELLRAAAWELDGWHAAADALVAEALAR